MPARAGTTRDVEAQALQRRVDLVQARLELEAVAAEHGLENATRSVSDLELISGFETEREKSGAGIETRTTPQLEVEFAIPIFDSGQARLRRAELAYLRAAQLPRVNLRSTSSKSTRLPYCRPNPWTVSMV